MKLYRNSGFRSTCAILALATLLAASASAQSAPSARTLVIDKIEAIPLDGPNANTESGVLYYRVDVRYPKAWMDKVEDSFSITVGGKPAPFEAVGGGFSDDANKSFRIYPGVSGRKLVQVSLVLDAKTVTATKELLLPGTPLVRLMDHVRSECLFENPPLTFLVFNATDPVVRVNAREVAAKAKPSQDFPGITLLTIPPSLEPGLNQIEITATGAAGRPVTEKSTLLFAANNTVKVGSKLNIVWGHMGSRSGPFFRLGHEGQVLAAVGSSEMGGQSVLNSGDDGKTPHWILASGVNVYSFTAQTPGKGKLNFEQQSHWTRPFETEKTVEITVVL